MSVFGTIVTGKAVRDSTADTLRLWMPTYLAEVAALSGRARGDLPDFNSYVSTFDVDRFAEDQLPSCVVVAPGLLDVPVRHGNGRYTAPWAVGIGVVVSGIDAENTFELVELYAAAVRAVVVQRPSLGGIADGVTWLNERYDELDTDDQRTIAAGLVQFRVDVPGTVDASQGPSQPVPDPTVAPADRPTVMSVTVNTEARE